MKISNLAVAVDRLVKEFSFLADATGNEYKKGDGEIRKPSKRSLSRGHAKNVQNKRERLRKKSKGGSELDGIFGRSVHKSKPKIKKSDSMETRLHIEDVFPRLISIIQELQNISVPSLVGLLAKYPEREFSRSLSNAISEYLKAGGEFSTDLPRLSVVNDICHFLNITTCLRTSRIFTSVLLESRNLGAIIKLESVILQVTQRKQRAMLYDISVFARNNPNNTLLLRLFEIARIVCERSDKSSTLLVAVRVISLCCFSQESIDSMISLLEEQRVGQSVRKASIAVLCDSRRCFHAVDPLVSAFRKSNSDKITRRLLKAIAKVGINFQTLQRNPEIKRLAEVVSISPSFEVILARGLSTHCLNRHPNEGVVLANKLILHSNSLSQVARFGVLSCLSYGRLDSMLSP